MKKHTFNDSKNTVTEDAEDAPSKNDFSAYVQDVTPLKQNYANLMVKVKPHLKKDQLLVAKKRLKHQPLSHSYDFYVGAKLEITDQSILEWRRSGIPHKQWKKFCSGGMTIEASLDLHGYFLNEAFEVWAHFIHVALLNRFKCVRLIHGKGKTLPVDRPRLKDHLVAWLREQPAVQGYCSCSVQHGGSGALYVWLSPKLGASSHVDN